MKRVLSVGLAVAVVAVLATAAFAQMQGPWGGGYGYMMGPRMMGAWGGPGGAGPGAWGCPIAGQQAEATGVTEDRAKELAQAYADQYLKGFTVDRVLPFSGPRGTMYSVELKGPDGQVRTFHINPWGNVMPFGGPARRG
jgi:hypothetical protein